MLNPLLTDSMFRMCTHNTYIHLPSILPHTTSMYVCTPTARTLTISNTATGTILVSNRPAWEMSGVVLADCVRGYSHAHIHGSFRFACIASLPCWEHDN